MSIFEHPDQDPRPATPTSLGEPAGPDPAARQRGVEVRPDAAVHRARGAAEDLRRPWLQRARVPVQPVRRPGARQRRGDRRVLLDDVRRVVPDDREDRGQRPGPAPDLRRADRGGRRRGPTATSAGTSRSSSSTPTARSPASARWSRRTTRRSSPPSRTPCRTERTAARRLARLCRRRPRSARPGCVGPRPTTASVPTWVAADNSLRPCPSMTRRRRPGARTSSTPSTASTSPTPTAGWRTATPPRCRPGWPPRTLAPVRRSMPVPTGDGGTSASSR